MQVENSNSQTAQKNETLTTYTGDVHALIAHGLQVLEQQAGNLKNVSHRDAMPAISEATRSLEQQKQSLERRVRELGGSATAPIKETASMLAGAAAGVVNAMRASETVKSLRDDATFFSGLGVAYLLLYTTASALGDSETARLAQSGYEDTARLAMHFDRILPTVTVEELREEDPKVFDVSDKVRAMVAGAWDRAKPSRIGSAAS